MPRLTTNNTTASNEKLEVDITTSSFSSTVDKKRDDNSTTPTLRGKQQDIIEKKERRKLTREEIEDAARKINTRHSGLEEKRSFYANRDPENHYFWLSFTNDNYLRDFTESMINLYDPEPVEDSEGKKIRIRGGRDSTNQSYDLVLYKMPLEYYQAIKKEQSQRDAEMRRSSLNPEGGKLSGISRDGNTTNINFEF